MRQHLHTNADKFYDKAAQLMERASDEEPLMRAFYEGLARSYYRLAWEADRIGADRSAMADRLDAVHLAPVRVGEEAEQPEHRPNLEALDRLARLLRVAITESFGDVRGPDRTNDEADHEDGKPLSEH